MYVFNFICIEFGCERVDFVPLLDKSLEDAVLGSPGCICDRADWYFLVGGLDGLAGAFEACGLEGDDHACLPFEALGPPVDLQFAVTH